MLELLAVVRATSSTSLDELLISEDGRFSRRSSVVVITATTEEQWVRQCRSLVNRGVSASAVLLEAGTFGGAPGSIFLVAALAAASIPTYLVKRGESLAVALSRPSTFAPHPVR